MATRRHCILPQKSDWLIHNISNHAAVFQLLVDVAEEEECKEVILAYYHLLVNEQALSAPELDRTVETWMPSKLNIDVGL